MATNFSERFSMDAKIGSTLVTGFMGTTQYYLCDLIGEHYNATRHDMTGAFEAYRFDRNTNEKTYCVLMICEQLNPGLLDNSQAIEEDTTQQTPCSTRYWENRLIFDSCFNPYENGSFIENFTQNETTYCTSFPGGYLDLFAATMPSDMKIIGEMRGFLKSICQQSSFNSTNCQHQGGTSSTLLSSCLALSSELSSDEFLYRMTTLWYDRDSKQIWVPENTLTNWYARESESELQKHLLSKMEICA